MMRSKTWTKTWVKTWVKTLRLHRRDGPILSLAVSEVGSFSAIDGCEKVTGAEITCRYQPGRLSVGLLP